MHYIFEAMWGHKIYTLFGILFVAICLVILVTAFITIALTYFQLAVEVSKFLRVYSFPPLFPPFFFIKKLLSGTTMAHFFPSSLYRASFFFGQDHRWWWRSLGSGGSIGLFVYAYCFYFFFHRTEMSGFLQTSTFFGYMGLMCFAIFLALGFVGFYSSLFFVRFVYSSIHVD